MNRAKPGEVLQQFDLMKNLNRELHKRIKEYAESSLAWDVQFMQGFTFKAGLDLLDEEFEKIFTSDNRNTIEKLNKPSDDLDNIRDRLEHNLRSYNVIKLALEVFFKNQN